MSDPISRRRFLRVTAAGIGFGLPALASLSDARASAANAAESASPLRTISDIWGDTIMKQPFDTQAFREIQPPGWLQETTRLLYGVGMLEDFDAAVAAGTQMGEIGFSDSIWVYYPSKLLKQKPDQPEDFIEKQIAEYVKYGFRIIAAVTPCFQAQMYARHPDWRAIPTNTTTVPSVDRKAHPEGGWLCQVGPWGDFLNEILAEILTLYPQVDAFSFDGIHHRQACYCRHCRDGYRKDTGQEIPDVSLDDPAFRRYMLWHDRRMEQFIERMQARIKGIKPEVALVTWTTNAGRFGHFRDIPRSMSARMNLLFDAPSQEFWMDETNRGNTVVPAFANAYIWAITNHRIAFSEPYLMSHGNPYGTDSFPQQEVLRRMLLVLTYGARPSHAIGWQGHSDTALHSIEGITRRAPYLTHKQPEPWAALLMSDITRNFYGRGSGQVEERYLASVLGAFRTGVEEHLPVTLINDWNLNEQDLSRCQVLILANAACLSDAQADAIRQFVEGGGGLIASVDTSLFDEMGNPRDDFALADLFGVHFQGTPSAEGGKTEQIDINFLTGVDESYWEKRKNIFDFQRDKHEIFEHPRLREYVGERPVTFKGQAVAVGALSPDATRIGTIAVRQGKGEAFPAMVVRRHGKGKVVYLAAGFDSAYYLYPYPYQRLILAQAMRWAAREPSPITVEAPMCVHTTFFRQKRDGAERLIVHLYNDLNSGGNHARPDEDVPLREEVVPIRDIKLTFQDYKISRVHLEPEGVEMKPSRDRDGLTVTVPELGIHSMVVAELER